MTNTQAPPDWVPVERRLLGMDRTTLLPAGLVAALVAVTFWVLPWIDSRVALEDPVRAGDVIQVHDVVQFVPATGWNLEEGLRVGTADAGSYPERAVLTRGGVTFAVQTGEFDGSATELIDQIKENNDKLGEDGVNFRTGELTAFQTTGGDRGVLARFTTTNAEGLIGALVLDGNGVEVTVTGPSALADDDTVEQDVVAMIASIEPAEGAAS